MKDDGLGNPSDDERFLKYLKRGRSRRQVHKEIRGYINPISKIEQDVNYFFDLLKIKAPKDIQKALKAELVKYYEKCSRHGFTRYRKRSVKDELMDVIVFYCIDKYKELIPQIDDNLKLMEMVSEGEIIILKKIAKKAGISPSYLPCDKYDYLYLFDHERMLASFKDDVPFELKEIFIQGSKGDVEILNVWEKIVKENYRRFEEGKRGVSMDYLRLLSFFYVMEKNGLKPFLKPFRELAALWGIKESTFNKKMLLLYKIDA
jgi:hypothetical protein